MSAKVFPFMKCFYIFEVLWFYFIFLIATLLCAHWLQWMNLNVQDFSTVQRVGNQMSTITSCIVIIEHIRHFVSRIRLKALLSYETNNLCWTVLQNKDVPWRADLKMVTLCSCWNQIRMPKRNQDWPCLIIILNSLPLAKLIHHFLYTWCMQKDDPWLRLC